MTLWLDVSFNTKLPTIYMFHPAAFVEQQLISVEIIKIEVGFC